VTIDRLGREGPRQSGPSLRVLRILDGRYAVVNRRVAVRRGDSAGKVDGYEVQRIEVLRLDNGRWRLVAGQGTRVQH
jgi:hypothetical protein